MLNHLNSLSCAAPLPCFVTLTFPDASFNDSVSAFAAEAKNMLDVWLKRLARVWPGACGFWRLEWQSRKSGLYEGKLFPHFHLMIWGLPVRSKEIGPVEHPYQEFFVPVREDQLGFGWDDVLSHGPEPEIVARSHRDAVRKWMNTIPARKERAADYRDFCQRRPGVLPNWEYMSFFDWTSLTWYHVVDSRDTKHFRAGVRVERVRTWGGVMTYCSKYMAKLGEHGFMTEIPVGRSWGIFNRAAVPWAKLVELDLPDEVGVRLRRVARHYLERVRGHKKSFPYGVTLYCNVDKWRRLWEMPPDTPF